MKGGFSVSFWISSILYISELFIILNLYGGKSSGSKKFWMNEWSLFFIWLLGFFLRFLKRCFLLLLLNWINIMILTLFLWMPTSLKFQNLDFFSDMLRIIFWRSKTVISENLLQNLAWKLSSNTCGESKQNSAWILEPKVEEDLAFSKRTLFSWSFSSAWFNKDYNSSCTSGSYFHCFGEMLGLKKKFHIFFFSKQKSEKNFLREESNFPLFKTFSILRWQNSYLLSS